jgi:hypothetical protein
MSNETQYKHHDLQDAHHQPRANRPWWRQPHKDWRVYVAVTLMLLAMFAYLATLDEALAHGNQDEQPVPAATGP